MRRSQRRNVWITRVSAAGLILLQFPCVTLAATEGRVRVHRPVKQEIYRGQKISFYVELLSSAVFSGTPRFELPDMAEGLLYAVQGSPVQGTATLNGVSYASQLYEFWFFPQKSGEITIASIPVQFATTDYQKTTVDKHALETQPLRVVVTEIPGVDSSKTIIVSDSFQAKQSWIPEPTDGFTGSAYTRIIHMEAKNLAAIFLPQIPFPDSEGASIYRKQPEVRDDNQRGEATGRRTDSATYLFEQEGQYTVPAIRITWWNNKRKTLEEVILEGSEFSIKPDPNRAQQAGQAVVAAKKQNTLLYPIVVLLTTLTLLFFILHRYTSNIRAWITAKKERYNQSERAYWVRLAAACKSGDLSLAYNRLYFWIRKRYQGEVLTPHKLAEKKGQKELEQELTSIDKRLFGAQKTPNTEWQGKGLRKQVAKLRRSSQVFKKNQRLRNLNTSLNFDPATKE